MILASTDVGGIIMINKKFTLLFFCIAFLFGIASIKVEAASNKKQIKNIISNFYIVSKKCNIKKMTDCFDKKADVDDIEFMIDFKKYHKKFNKSLNYNITSIKVRGNKATAKVTCKYTSAYNAFYHFMFNMAKNVETDIHLSDKALEKKMFKRLNKNLKVYPPQKSSKKITFTLIQKKGEWKIKKCTNAIINSVDSDFTNAFLDFYKDIIQTDNTTY